MGRVWLAEKPSFAIELSKALGGGQKISPVAWETPDGVVVAAAGHLVELCEPHDYNEAWKEWTVESLPMIPDGWQFKYKPIAGKEQRLRAISTYLRAASEIIVATDAGREGEYIAWAIFEMLGIHGKPMKRLWSSGANVAAIKKACQESALLPYDEKYPLAEAARVRAESDWVEGLNLTRLLTTRFRPAEFREPITVGRVQTATLALIVRRTEHIETFKPQKYFDLAVDISVGPHSLTLNHRPPEEKRITDAAEARQILASAKNQNIKLEVKSDIKSEAPPKLFESSSLQIRAYNLWGWSAEKTEKLAQALYDQHKLISYPRTDGVHLEDEQWHDVREILANIRCLSTAKEVQVKGKEYFVDFPVHAPNFETLSPRETVFNSKALEKSGADHHGIIPTTEPANLTELSDDERKLYLLIVRQFLAQLMPDCKYAQKSIAWTHEGRRFAATGRVIKMQGWQVLFSAADQEAEDEEADEKEEGGPSNLPDLTDGQLGKISRAFAEEKFTVAPPLFTEGSIISAMRDLNKVVKDPKLREKLKIAKTIGTKSTWGDTIKKLKERQYITSSKGKLQPTILGRDLINLCDEHLPALVDPTATAVLEFMLTDVEKGKCQTAQARQILQSRNYDAISRSLAIENATLRAPENMKVRKSSKPKTNAPFKDFEGGSYALDAPFEDRDAIKELGGRFNGQSKRWHLPKSKYSAADLKARGWLK